MPSANPAAPSSVTVSAFAANSITAAALAADAGAEIADAVWDEAKSGHTTVGTYGGDEMRSVVKTLAFTGATGLGEVGAVALFTTTGNVHVVGVMATCTEDLVSAGAGNLSLGVTGNTALFVAATVATAIDSGEKWVDTAPDANGVALPAAMKDIQLSDNDEIIATVDTGDITDGTIEFVVWYVPANGGSLAAA